MELARMQDLGGCRIVVDENADAEKAVAAITRRSSPHYEVVRVTDYRGEGRQTTGYRAIHVIVRRDGYLLEIQVRTRRQHGWAEAVERAANRTNVALKDGDGPPALVNFFKHTSDCLAALDDGKRLQDGALAEFRRHDAAVAPYFPHDSNKTAPKFAVSPKTVTTRENNWLLVYDWRSGSQYRWQDCGTDPLEAARMYSKSEREFPWREGYEVVLIGSDSRDTIEWTHAHYFGRSVDDIDPHGVLDELRAA
jgi:hypothetical protein